MHMNGLDSSSISSDIHQFTPARHELRCMLKELTLITDRLRKTQEDEQVTSDWKFAASVLDRLLLWIFFFFILVSSCAILLSVPGIFVKEGGIE